MDTWESFIPTCPSLGHNWQAGFNPPVTLPLHSPHHIILSSTFSEHSLDDSRSKGLQNNPDKLVEGRKQGSGRDFQSTLDSIWGFRLKIRDKPLSAYYIFMGDGWGRENRIMVQHGISRCDVIPLKEV